MPEADTDDGEAYWNCGPADPRDRADLDTDGDVVWTDGELLREWIDCGGDTEEFARRVKVAHDSCDGRDITYTGVDPGGERRECPACSGEVDIDPVEDEVRHVAEK